jgi:hypothetical protein
LNPRRLIAQDDEANIVTLWIEAEVIHRQHVVRPSAAADTLDRHQFALQVFGFL